MSKFQIQLGVEAKDKVTGFKGIITARVEYLTGCNQYGLVQKISKDGKVSPCELFDEGRIVVTGKGISASSVKAEENGGPNRDCPK